MTQRLLPASLFATAAALYWLAVHAGLHVVGAIQLFSTTPADDGCGGECTAYVTPADMLEPLVLSAVAAALAAAAVCPRLAARFDDRPESVQWPSVWITVGAYVLGSLGVFRGLDVSAEMLVGPLIFSPLLLTALPFGLAAGHVWWRLTPTAPTPTSTAEI